MTTIQHEPQIPTVVEEMKLETLDDLKAFLRTHHLVMQVGSTSRGQWGATIAQCGLGVIAAAEREDFATAVRAAVLEALATIQMLEQENTKTAQEWN
jgi:hypothetical protein